MIWGSSFVSRLKCKEKVFFFKHLVKFVLDLYFPCVYSTARQILLPSLEIISEPYAVRSPSTSTNMSTEDSISQHHSALPRPQAPDYWFVTPVLSWPCCLGAPYLNSFILCACCKVLFVRSFKAELFDSCFEFSGIASVCPCMNTCFHRCSVWPWA